MGYFDILCSTNQKQRLVDESSPAAAPGVGAAPSLSGRRDSHEGDEREDPSNCTEESYIPSARGGRENKSIIQ